MTQMHLKELYNMSMNVMVEIHVKGVKVIVMVIVIVLMVLNVFNEMDSKLYQVRQ